MAYRSSFPPVYPGLNDLPDEAVTTATPRFLSADADLLRSVAASTSIITHICQNAIRDAAAYCRANNIHSFADQSRLVDYLRQRSAVGVTLEAAGEDVTRRDTGAGEQSASAAGQRAEARSGTTRGGSTGGGKARTAKGTGAR